MKNLTWKNKLFQRLRRRWEITESLGVTRLPLHVMPGEGPVSTSCSAVLRKGVDTGPFARHDDLTSAMPNLEQLFTRGS
jgi:hypothetical protein